MKGIVFTIDAVFAIMIATIAISILLYFNYMPVNQYNIKASSLGALENTLSTTNLQNLSSPLAAQINYQNQAANEGWYGFYQNNTGSNSNANGPYTDSLLMVYNTSTDINASGIVAANGAISILRCYCDVYYNSYGYVGQFGGHNSNNPGYLIYYNNEYISANNTDVSNGRWFFYLPSSSSKVSSPILGYDNMIIVPVYTSGNSVETGIIGLNANNGTEAWILNIGGEVNSIAIANGEMAAEVGNTIKVFGYQGQGVPISLYNTTYSYSPTRIIFYGGSFYVADSSSIEGISAYNNALFSQSTSNYTSGIGNVSSGAWKVYMPPYIGRALNGGQPVASNGNLYTLWSNNYLVDQNPYSGQIKWTLQIPYSGTLSPRMILAYGELYVVIGNKLLSFGSCPGISDRSILSNMVSFYAARLSGCADTLLNTVNPSQNASVMTLSNFITGISYNKTLIYPYVLNFTGQYNYVSITNNSALSPEAGVNGRMSLCAWYEIKSLSGYQGVLFKGKTSPSNGNAWEYALDQGGYTNAYPSFTVWDSSGQDIAYGQANTITFNSIVNNWSFACFTYDYPDQKADYYFNGVQYNASITTSYGPAVAGSGNIIIGGGVPSGNGNGYSNISVADLQIYSVILSPGQIKTLYNQGITASPIQSDGLVGWWPLGGDANDYSGNGHTGFPFAVVSTYAGFISPGYQDSQSVSVSKSVLITQNIVEQSYINEYMPFYLSSTFNETYVAGVYSWG